MANTIRGNGDGPNGENLTYTVPGRGSDIPRAVLVAEVDAGKHPNYSTYTLNNVTYVRGNPDGRGKNNVNQP